MTTDPFLIGLLSLAIGGFIGWIQGVSWAWLRAYKRGLEHSREVWLRAKDEAYADLLLGLEKERGEMAVLVRQAINSRATEQRS